MTDFQLVNAFLGLSNVNVVSYALLSAERLEVGVESSLDAALCPTCLRVSTQVHDIAELQTLRDLPIRGRQCWLRYAPRRFGCATCHSTFVERVAWREPGFAYKLRYAQHVYARTQHEDIAQIAHHEGLSQDTVRGIFERWAKNACPTGLPARKGAVPGRNHDSQRPPPLSFGHFGSGSGLGARCLIDRTRTKESLEAWLAQRGPEWCAYVETCCADMWDAYHMVAQAKLPHAQRVVDRFDVMKNLTDALTKARRTIQKQANEATQAILKGGRWLLCFCQEPRKPNRRRTNTTG